jgi:phosphoglycolate phosphatase-like HAD superfamily hydrolase
MTDRAFIFDLDGTLVDNVYEHVLAWKMALDEAGFVVPTWRVHRHIGMSGHLLVEELAKAAGGAPAPEVVEWVGKRHGEIFRSLALIGRPLPGAPELLDHLSKQAISWAIATSGHAENARAALESLRIDASQAVVVTRDQVQAAKPAPDLFLEAARRLQRPIEKAFVVGDSVWDMIAATRGGARGLGLLSGGYAESELNGAGASRVFPDPAGLLSQLENLLA